MSHPGYLFPIKQSRKLVERFQRSCPIRVAGYIKPLSFFTRKTKPHQFCFISIQMGGFGVEANF